MAKGSVNKVILIGHLGDDPDVRYSPSGTPIAKLSVATNESVKNSQSGAWEEKTEWHRVTAFGKLAENCGNYLSKGRQVYVEGGLRTNQWTDEAGVKRYSTEIVARDIQFLGGNGAGQPQRGEETRGGAPEPLPPSTGDDIPF